MPTREVDLVANVPQRVLGENQLRQDYTIKNDSASNIFVGKDIGVAAAGFHRGQQINATGGSFNDRWYKGEVWLICASSITALISVDENVSTIGVSTQRPVMVYPVPTISHT